MAYRNEHYDSRPLVLAFRGLEEPQQEISEGRADRCRDTEYREEPFAICEIYPTRQQRSRKGKRSGCCKPFELERSIVWQTRIAIVPLWIARAAKITKDSSCESGSETIDDPRASPSDNACKTSPKVRAKPFAEVETVDTFPAAVRDVAGRWALVEADLDVVGRGDRPESSSNSPSSISNSIVKVFGDSEPRSEVDGAE